MLFSLKDLSWELRYEMLEYIGNYGYEIVYRAGNTKSFSSKKKKKKFLWYK